MPSETKARVRGQKQEKNRQSLLSLSLSSQHPCIFLHHFLLHDCNTILYSWLRNSDSKWIYYHAFIFTYHWVWIQKPHALKVVCPSKLNTDFVQAISSHMTITLITQATLNTLRTVSFDLDRSNSASRAESEMILLRIISSVLPRKCLLRGVKLTSIPSAHCKRIVSHCSHPRDARLS